MATLKDVMPHEFMGIEYVDSQARKFADVEVVSQHGSTTDNIPWIGKRTNVFYWVKLANGKAVGWNESPSRGWSFEVVKYS